MPLLMCPNCNSSMQAVNRTGVEFDMCPTCRGVWLDRGELEKILADARETPAEGGAQERTFERPQPRYDSDRRDDRYRDSGYGYKKKRSSLFDIFD